MGAFITAQLGHKHAERMIGIHLHTPGTMEFMTGVGWNDADYGPEEAHRVERMTIIRGSETGHFAIQATKPQTLAVGLNDSPAGLLAWLVDKRRNWSDCGGDVERRFSKDELIDTVMLYWLTQCFHTSARYYYEGVHVPWRPSHDRKPVIEAPTALAIFPGELTFPPRKGAERYYNLQRWTEMPSGGHFAPAEEPALIVEDLRAFSVTSVEKSANAVDASRRAFATAGAGARPLRWYPPIRQRSEGTPRGVAPPGNGYSRLLWCRFNRDWNTAVQRHSPQRIDILRTRQFIDVRVLMAVRDGADASAHSGVHFRRRFAQPSLMRPACTGSRFPSYESFDALIPLPIAERSAIPE